MRNFNKKQHLPERSPGRVLRNEMRENPSRRWGEEREDAELQWEINKMGFFKKKEKEEPVKELRAIVSGQVIPVSEVADPVFSSKALGDGIAIRPEGQVITAPCSGEISMVAETRHALGITVNNGAELLLHIGLDTVSLGGEGFKVLDKQGKKVKQGDALLEFDKALVERKGLATDCILIVTNSDDLPGMKLVSGIDAVQNETVVCTF